LGRSALKKPLTKDRLRVQLAQEIARIVVEEGIEDRAWAHSKAASRLGSAAKKVFPRDTEVASAIAEYHRIYRSDIQPQHILELRRKALQAMQFLSMFSPLLVGSVWDGSAGPFSAITLHLFPASAEDVIQRLVEAKIPYRETSQTMDNERTKLPALCLVAGGTRIELLVYPLGWKPGEGMTQIGMRLSGGDLTAVKKLLADYPLGASGAF
jgi:hypothetical protein